MKRCNLSFTLETQVNSRSQRSSKGRSATGSKSVVYLLGPLFDDDDDDPALLLPEVVPVLPEVLFPCVLPLPALLLLLLELEFEPLFVQQLHIHE
jgi:hypothetical protein